MRTHMLFVREFIRTMSANVNAKRQQIMKTIGTHNGTFHCDEVLACFLLRQLPEYRNAEVVRSRDAAVLDKCDVVVDVGAVYDPTRHRYDHHQRAFSESMHSLRPQFPWSTKLSSAGLVYLHFGRSVLTALLPAAASEQLTDALYEKIYESFVEAVDAIDNGISQTDEKPRYFIGTGLSARVGYLNPSWNETTTDAELDERFAKAMDMVGLEFIDRVNYYSSCWWPARELVKEAMDGRFKVSETGEVMLLPKSGCPWKEHLFAIEDEERTADAEKKDGAEDVLVKYVLYEDGGGNWRVQCAPKDRYSFDSRLALPEAWRGMRDGELSALSGVPGCVFVHTSGFIGGNASYDGALQMALLALKQAPRE